MNDETRPHSTDPIGPIDASLADADRPTTATGPAASFTGRTARKSHSVRAGIIVGTGLVVALGAAVAMGASPSAAPSSDAGGQTQPSTATGPAAPGRGGPGFEFGHGGMKGGPGRGDGRGFGQISVTAASGSSLSLATADGWTRTIAITDATKVTKGGAAAALADITVGDAIRFSQTPNADGTFTITAIEIVQPHVAGTVTAVAADSLTITLRDGTSQTIKTTESTTYHVERADGTRADVTVGAAIVATGERATDGSLTAASVWVRLPHVRGTVTGTTGDTITITARDGSTVTVHVGSGTTFRVADVDTATIADVKAGMRIVVEGPKRADGSIDATEIGAGDMGGRGKGLGRGHNGPPDANPDASTGPDASAGTEG